MSGCWGITSEEQPEFNEINKRESQDWDYKNVLPNSPSHRSFFHFYVATTPDSRVAHVNSIFILLGFSQPIFPSAPSKAFLTENTHF